MKSIKLVIVFALLALMLLAAFGVSAQSEATPEATPVVVPVGGTVIVEPPAPVPPETYGGFSATELALIVVLLVVLAGGGVLLNSKDKRLQEAMQRLHNSIPEWAWEALQSGTDRGFDELHSIVEATPNTIDDDLFRRFEEQKNKFFEEMRRELPAQIAQAMNESPPKPPGSLPPR